jgi:hypothetical protein
LLAALGDDFLLDLALLLYLLFSLMSSTVS